MKKCLVIILIGLLISVFVQAGIFDFFNNLLKPQEQNLSAGVLPPFYIQNNDLLLRRSILQRGDILIATTTNQLYKLAAGTEGYVLSIISGIPTWAASTELSNTISISFLSAATTKDVEFSKQFAMTLTKVSCYSLNGSSTINIVDKGTARSLASTTLSSSLVCTTGSIASSTTFSLSTIQADDILDASTTAITGTPDTYININYTRTGY